MKDLDFDEIDRAVGSAMGGSEPKASESSPFIEQLKNDVKADPAPENAPSEPVEPVAVKSEPRVIPHRKGQFLDMVNPNANMKHHHHGVIPPKVSHEAASIEPDSSARKDTPVAAEEPPKEQPKTEPVTPGVENLDDQDDDVTEINPDKLIEEPEEDPKLPEGIKDELLEAHSEDTEPKGLIEEESGKEAPKEPEKVTKQPEQLEQDEESALDTPFLPDTKVEKRPLGGGEPEVIASTPDVHQEIKGLSTAAPAEPAPVIVKSKGKSGWLWALLVVLLVILGAGIGFVVYLFWLS
ncbi:hypothetical protein FWF48_02150 [Candidatus Saccharibacteria bacterium]|nr:hypothetical protein [Candidatus Saccharibacteria bacterium]